MHRQFRFVTRNWLGAALVVLGCGVTALAQFQQGVPSGIEAPPGFQVQPIKAKAEPAEVQALKKASANGKYSKLLSVIHVPADEKDYGKFHDYGHYNDTSWAGYAGLPTGYWVYVAPHWYIWEKQGKAAVVQPAKGDKIKASVNGKYIELLKVIEVPQDRASYGDFHDYGMWNGTEWAGYTDLPPGHWVYVAPNWYIWGDINLKAIIPNQQQQAPANQQEVKASVNGKYIKLLKVIDVPQDRAQYGEFNDWGFWTGTSWAGFNNLPQGYWVYVAPHWYIWGDINNQAILPNQQQQGAPANPQEVKASVNGKYSQILRIINVPLDKVNYGEFSDYGYYSGTEWAGYDNLPPGYWVYVSPNWYIWGKQDKKAVPAPKSVPTVLLRTALLRAAVKPPEAAPPDQVKASVNGKYSKLLKVINVPQDQADYGAFSDYGYYTGTSWAGFDNLPVGYWVYVAPNWYIWGQQGNAAVAPPNAKPNPNGVPAGANLTRACAKKYVNLLKVIDVPQDQGSYGEFNDWGHWTGTSWAGFNNLPQGYWVYVAPHWYIWGDLRQRPDAPK
jgi:hypothetical protein